MAHKALPVSGWNQAVAKGTVEKAILGVDSSNSAQTTSSSAWREFFVPDEKQFNSATIRVGDPRPTYADPSANYENFLWCDVNPDADPTAAILSFNYNGKSAGVAMESGQSLGFFKSTSEGKSVVLWARE